MEAVGHYLLSAMTHYWFMFPVAILTASMATSSGFGGAIIFFPIFIYVLKMSVPEAIGTGMVTELCGMTSGMIGYTRQKQIEFSMAFPMVLLTIPGVVIGLHLVMVLNEAILKIFFGLIVMCCAVWTFMSMAE